MFQEHLVSEKREKPESMNAFALISRSQGFNLGNLFEKEISVSPPSCYYFECVTH
jgi:hypothetical protein